MPHGKTALTLMMALALPGAVEALGLGEIHLDSALDEPLAADIDLVGAAAEDLDGITASVANRETFERLGVDRSAFLSGVAFKITRDSSGRAVLAIRSKDACTEPLLNLLVDVRWRGGELVRQYTLLLDPPGFPLAARVADAAVNAPASHALPVGDHPVIPRTLIEASKPASQSAPAWAKGAQASAEGTLASAQATTTGAEPAVRKTIRVGAKATLRGIAWRVGSRSDADLNRMMMAIFRANPNAFEGNINRLRRGAVLTIPSAAEVSSISVAAANHEVYAQMQAWRASTPAAKSAAAGPVPTLSATAATLHESSPPSTASAGGGTSAGGAATAGGGTSAAGAATAPAGAANAGRGVAETGAPAETALDHRVEQLEKGLGELQHELDREQDALVRAQAQLTLAEQAPAVVVPQPPRAVRGLGASIAAILGLAAAAFGAYAWRRRRAPQPRPSPVDPKLQNLPPEPVTAPAPVREMAAPNPPVPAVPRAMAVATQNVPHESHEADARDSAIDASAAVDAEALEVSYLLLQGSGGGFDDIVRLGDTDETASLPLTVKLRVEDPGAETMPVETARIVGLPESTTRGLGAPEDTVTAKHLAIDATKLDYNLLDLDATVQHVQMPSALHENVGFKERRTSLVDVLRRAVEREPNRRDLRMKLLETYYAAAATNRQAFLEIFQKAVEDRANLEAGEWDKIAWMGRQIAPEVLSFAPVEKQSDEEDLVNCA